MTIAADVDLEFGRIIAAEFGRRPTPGPEPVGEWLTHRICAPDHAAAVYRRCLNDRRVLPRWHQDDRGERNTVRGFRQAAAAGAYRGITVWSGRAHWLDIVVPAAIAAHPDVLAKHHVAPSTFARWARVKSGYADPRTGRRCIVRPDTVASVMGMEQSTVMRCQRVARDLGLEVVVMAGRMLTYDERARAERWGSRQRGLSNEVALTTPAELRQVVASRTRDRAASVDHDTPSRGLQKNLQSNLLQNSRDGLRPTQKDGAPRRPREKDRSRWWGACRLASELASSVPWLAGEGRRRLAPALMRFATAPTPWTAAELVTALNMSAELRGDIHEGMIRTRPAILLAAILRRLDPVLDHPTAGGSFASGPAAPCGGDTCDGHGWINGTDADGRAWARPCPDCPPAIRRGDTVGAVPREPGSADEGGNPF